MSWMHCKNIIIMVKKNNRIKVLSKSLFTGNKDTLSQQKRMSSRYCFFYLGFHNLYILSATWI